MFKYLNIIFIILTIIVIIFLFYLFFKRDNFKKISSKPKFQETLEDAKKLLDSINVKFHLHSGTALGALREKDFIEHDNDIDLGVFKEDYKEIIIETMEKEFNFSKKYGSIDNGLELKFIHKKNNIGIDIFLIYKKEDKLYQSVYNCKSERFEKGTNSDDQCIMYMNHYEPILIEFLGKEYYCAPISFLVDRYGEDWKTPKVFNYHEGLDKHYESVEKYKKS
jgi:hypothetical protein